MQVLEEIDRASDGSATADGADVVRDNPHALRYELFRESVARFHFPQGRIPSPTAPHVLGMARRPSPAA